MIYRILIPIIIGTILPYLWIFKTEFQKVTGRKRFLLWIPAMIVLGYSVYLAFLPNFVPKNPLLVDIWFALMAVCAVPEFVFAFCSSLGWCCKRYFHLKKNWGRTVGLVLAILAFVTFVYGFTLGFRKLEVKQVTIYLSDLPKNFDGYRIVLFSDFHQIGRAHV